MKKPAKPTPDFPLFAHDNGQWAKKVKGRLCYFGPWDDPQAALARFLDPALKAKQKSVLDSLQRVKEGQGKPEKPYPDFPLYPHANGQWAKKIRGRVRYFGPWNDPEAALAQFLGPTPQASNGHRRTAPKQKSVSGSPRLVEERQNKDGQNKPKKPYPGFPLYPHTNGQWAKRIRGKIHYFGAWNDPDGALRRFHKEESDVKEGRRPKREREQAGVLTVKQMVHLFLEARKLHVESGEMEARTWREYKTYGERMIRVFGANVPVETLGPGDFDRLRKDFQKTHKSLRSIRGDIRKIKVFFNWAGPGVNGRGYFDRMPRFGDGFRAPSQTALDREREERGEPAVYTPAQIHALLKAAGTNIKAMILLGVNCGYGNMDCVKLPINKLDLEGGWANFPRTKNGIRRRNPLWPETVEALKAVLAARKMPIDPRHHNRVFITKWGKAYKARNLSREVGYVLTRVQLDRAAVDFYDLRRTCASIGVQLKDDDAVRTIMGHKRAATDMLGVYNRLQVDDARLLAVSNHIRDWCVKGSATPQTPPETGGNGQPDALSEPAA